jgi:hypothetical protein
MTDLFSKFDPLIAEREHLLSAGVRDPFAIVMQEVKSPTVAIIDGKRTSIWDLQGLEHPYDQVAERMRQIRPICQ